MSDGSGDEIASNRTASEIMKNQILLDRGLPLDRMPEAEVALRLAVFILSLPGSGAPWPASQLTGPV